jgi:long-chain acyl-CoA synthetase
LDLLHRNADTFGSSVAAIDAGRRWTWQDYREDASTLALALLDLGVEHGDRVGIMLPNRAEHVLVDSGALLAGATPTSFYATLAADQLEHVARDSGCAIVVVGAEFLDTWLELRSRLPALRHLVVVDAGTRSLPDGVLRYEEIAPASHRLDDHDVEHLATVSGKVTPDDPATIVYTSGTTGPPKGTIVTHRGVRFVMDAVAARIEASDPDGRFSSMAIGGQVRIPVGLSGVSYLPLAHLAERLFTYYLGISHAMTVTYCRDMSELRGALVEASV